MIMDYFICICIKCYFNTRTADQPYGALGTAVSPQLHFMSAVRILKLKIQESFFSKEFKFHSFLSFLLQ